jgi:hypothetical protein
VGALHIVLDLIRVGIFGGIFGVLLVAGHRLDLRHQRGSKLIAGGFGMLFLGAVLHATGTFESLNHGLIVGDALTLAIFEEAGGYLLGAVLLFLGLWQWLPLVGALGEAKNRLEHRSNDLEAQVIRRME